MIDVTAPAIWVGSLEDYNAGRLHGEWVDLEGLTTADEIREAIARILETSPEARTTGRPSEEWDIFDHEGIPPKVAQSMNLETIAGWLEIVDRFADDPERLNAFAAWCGHVGWDYALRDLEAMAGEFEGAYIGTFDDVVDFATSHIDDMYPELVDQMNRAGLQVDYRDAVAGWETDWLALEDVPGGRVAAWYRI